MTADPALKKATYADLEAVRPHLRVAPFDAVGFPMNALFPFDEPYQKPSEEA